MAKSPKKKKDRRKKHPAPHGRVTYTYAVSKGAFTGNVTNLLQYLLEPEQILPRPFICKEDVVYLMDIKQHEAYQLINKIRRTKRTSPGRYTTMQEFCSYTGIPEGRVYHYLFSLTVNERILS